MRKRAARLERRRPDLKKGVVFASPAEPGEVEQYACLLGLFRPIDPAQASAPVSAVEDEAVDPFRMPGRVFDSDRAAPAGRQQIKSSEGRGLDDAFEILDP